MSSKQKRKKSIIVRVLVLAVSVYMIATLARLWGDLRVKQNELDALLQEKQNKIIQRDSLQQLLDEGSHEEIIEKAARERLGYVYPDEEIYIDISGN